MPLVPVVQQDRPEELVDRPVKPDQRVLLPPQAAMAVTVVLVSAHSSQESLVVMAETAVMPVAMATAVWAAMAAMELLGRMVKQLQPLVQAGAMGVLVVPVATAVAVALVVRSQVMVVLAV